MHDSAKPLLCHRDTGTLDYRCAFFVAPPRINSWTTGDPKAVTRGDAVNAEILSLDGVIYLALINDEPLKSVMATGKRRFPSAHAAGRPSTPWVFERGPATTPPMTR